MLHFPQKFLTSQLGSNQVNKINFISSWYKKTNTDVFYFLDAQEQDRFHSKYVMPFSVQWRSGVWFKATPFSRTSEPGDNSNLNYYSAFVNIGNYFPPRFAFSKYHNWSK